MFFIKLLFEEVYSSVACSNNLPNKNGGKTGKTEHITNKSAIGSDKYMRYPKDIAPKINSYTPLKITEK